jgi:hypothetical protein
MGVVWPQRRPFGAISATLPTRRKHQGKVRDQQVQKRPQRIPKFANETVAKGDNLYDSKDEIPADVPHIFPSNSFKRGAEMDVKIIKAERDYALCRPLDYPAIKGIIYRHEMDEEIAVADATGYFSTSKKMIYKASIVELMTPDKVIFSLRRVRRLVRDDFQPFTIVIFDLPYELGEEDLHKLLEESTDGGKVLEIRLSYGYRGNLREPSFVTFLKREHAMKAMRKWNWTAMPVLDVGGAETEYYRVRCKKATQQVYRDQVQEHFDKELQDRIKKWDWTVDDLRNQYAANEILYAAIPWHIADQHSKEMYDRIGMNETHYQYSVKNDPRWAR